MYKQLLHKNILVLPEKKETTRASGIIILDNVKDTTVSPVSGKVLQVSNKVDDIYEGDTVQYNLISATVVDVTIEGEKVECHIVSEENIISAVSKK